MRFPRNGRRRGGRWLTAVLARWLGVGAVPAWCRRAWAWPRRRVRVVGACLPGALERRAPRALIRAVGAVHALDERRGVQPPA